MRTLLPVLLLACAACPALVAPESEIASALYHYAQGAAPAFEVGGARVRIERVAFARVLVKPEGRGYTAVATVDAEGRLEGGPHVSYLGLERIPFVRDRQGPRPRGALLPALAELIECLRAKDAAVARGDAAALQTLLADRWDDPSVDREKLLRAVHERGPAPASPPAASWFIRIERDGADVLEERPGSAGQPARRTRYRLVREREGFRFSSGLR